MSKFLGRLSGEQIAGKATAQQQLLGLAPQYDYLCCFDVDGHLLDNMTSKQVIVFHPHFMDIFGLREIETFVRLHAEHHNLWSTDRGCDRHEAISFTLGSLLEDPALKAVISDEMTAKLRCIRASLDGYISDIQTAGEAYGFDSLHAYQQAHADDANLTLFCIWSRACDLTFPFVTIPMPPFPNVRETLQYVAHRSDVLIVSKTPYDDICNWLERHELMQYVTAVCGKGQGGKDEHICLAMGGTFDAKEKAVVAAGSKYRPENVIMGGDGNGDLKAAKKNDAFFFPTPPAQEETAWEEAIDEVFGPFFEGTYAEREPGRIEAFRDAMLPQGPWKEAGYDHTATYAGLQGKRRQLYRQLKPGGKFVAV